MKKDKKKIIVMFLIIITVIFVEIEGFAHSGRTDSNGGHKDNKNKSGLGSYHYHCGGHPAHLHTNGICPYSSSSSSSVSSKSSSSTTGTTSINTVTENTATIDVTEIKINENIKSLELGKSKTLTVTIIPSNATDKNITWKSSNETIATVSTTGDVLAKNPGNVEITATSANGKTSTIKISIEEETKVENNDIIKTSTIDKNNTVTTATTNNQESSNPAGGILTLGLLGGAGYWAYNKFKKK